MGAFSGRQQTMVKLVRGKQCRPLYDTIMSEMRWLFGVYNYNRTAKITYTIIVLGSMLLSNTYLQNRHHYISGKYILSLGYAVPTIEEIYM